MRIATAVAFVEMFAGSAASAASLSDAQSLYSRNQVAAAVQEYQAVAADPKADSDTRSIAERELGRIAWLIDGDAPTAQKSRADLIAQSAANKQRIYAVHFPYPAVGTFEQRGQEYVWKPE